jgi:hypothetical protein
MHKKGIRSIQDENFGFQSEMKLLEKMTSWMSEHSDDSKILSRTCRMRISKKDVNYSKIVEVRSRNTNWIDSSIHSERTTFKIIPSQNLSSRSICSDDPWRMCLEKLCILTM